MTKIKVATVGTGYFSRFQYAAWSRIEEVSLVSVCNRSEEAAKEVADIYNIPKIYTDFDQMLDIEKPDLVDIITPPVTHTAYVQAALKRSLPVICQKPFTPSLGEAQSLVNEIKQHNGKVIIHENFRFQPWYTQIKKILSSGELGELYHIAFALRPGDGQGESAYLDRQPYFQKMPRFLIHETAIHLIDVFRYLFGDVQSLSSHLRRVNPVIQGEDAGILLFEFANGATGVFDGNRLSDHKAENRRLTMGEMRIEGSLGTVSLNGDGQIFLRKHGENAETEIDYNWQNRDFGGDCVYALQRHVVDHLISGTPLMNSAESYLTNILIAEAAYQSHEKGLRIKLN